jgi:predicted esterase
VVFPVYKGAMERNDRATIQIREGMGVGPRQWADYMILLVKDFARALEYVETRKDIDRSKMSFYGFSEGGLWSPMLLTVAGDRIKVSVLHLGALSNANYQPQADAFNYVTRIKVPTLMLNGIYDPNLTLRECVEPMYRLLGTPDKDKKLKLYESDHFIHKSELVKETLAWYDKYLGPVQK